MSTSTEYKHTNNNTAVSVASDGRTTFTTQPQITTPICFQASRIDLKR